MERKRERKEFSEMCNFWNQTAAERAGAIRHIPLQPGIQNSQKIKDLTLQRELGPDLRIPFKPSRLTSKIPRVQQMSVQLCSRIRDHNHRGEECARALATLSLGPKVLRAMNLPIPAHLAASQIQSSWRGFATRKVLPVLISHAHRICMLVERHRKRCLSKEGISEELLGKNVLGFANLEHYDNPFSQKELKGKLRLLWSSKRSILPIPCELRNDIPYRSASIDVHICICFVTNFISFHVGKGEFGRNNDVDGSASSALILQRLNAIVDKDHEHLIRKLQACFRGWSVRKMLFGTCLSFPGPVKHCIRDAIKRRCAGLVILRFLRKMVWGIHWMKIKPIVVQLMDIAKSQKTFYMSLDHLYRTVWVPLEKRASSNLECNTLEPTFELGKIYVPNFPQITPRDLAVMFGNFTELRSIVLHQLNSVAACIAGIPRLDLKKILQVNERLLVALSQYTSNFPQAMLRLFEFRQHDGFELWMAGLECSMEKSLISNFMDPVEHLDASLSKFARLRDLLMHHDRRHSMIQIHVKNGLQIVGQLRYRKRDCHSMLRLLQLSRQFTGDIAFALVKPHRRLIRSKKVKAISYTTCTCAINTDGLQHDGPESHLLLFLFNDILLGTRIRTKTLPDGTMTPVKRQQSQHEAYGAQELPPLLVEPMQYESAILIQLLEASIVNQTVQEEDFKLTRMHVHIEDNHGQVLLFEVQNGEDHQIWLSELSAAIQSANSQLTSPYEFPTWS
mmetsp:Transcript_610/g.1594  ORF Transcript_610/g.1594 Transcript_610/m.1594 type:complete len:734 (+) Transcript_610:169-2370(+)